MPSPRILLGDVIHVPATSRPRSDPGQERSDAKRDGNLDFLPLQDGQPTMGTADDHINTKNHSDTAIAGIEPKLAASIRVDTIPPLPLPGIDQAFRAVESSDRHLLSILPPDDDALSVWQPIGTTWTSFRPWEALKDPQMQEPGGQARVKKVKILLQWQREKLDLEQAALLPRLKALASEFSVSKLQALVRRLEEIGNARQRLGDAEKELYRTETQLSSDEWRLHDLESTLHDNPMSAFESDFPTGWLDFTGDSPPRTKSDASFTSSPPESPPEKFLYEQCLREVDRCRESLLDLESEHNQLLQQRAKRSRLGLDLDSFSRKTLEQYDVEHAHLENELEQAEIRLEHAEVVWTRTKEPVSSPDDMTGQEENFYELAVDGEASLRPLNEFAMSIARIFQESEPEASPVYKVPSFRSNGHVVNMATFINQWLLQRVRQCPEESTRLANVLASSLPNLTAEHIAAASMSNWLLDSTEKEFYVAVDAGDHSYHESLAPNNGLEEILHDRATSQHLHSPPGLTLKPRVANTAR